jgi:hypothetical protein
MNDYIYFAPDFPANLRTDIRQLVFAWRIFYNLSDEAFGVWLRLASDGELGLRTTSPDAAESASYTIPLSAATSVFQIVEKLEDDYQAWRSRIGKPIFQEVFDGGPY